MEYTPFAGLTVLDDGESIRADGSSFLVRNPQVTDHFLKIGALTHRHNAAVALASPGRSLGASAVASGGQLAAGQSFSLTYTLTDADGGETLPAPAVTVETGAGVGAPSAPTAAPDYTQGIMPAGDYYYAKTVVDGSGGETTIGPTVKVTVDQGHASASVGLSGLATEVNADLASAWRLWRSYDGADWHLVLQGTADTYLDTGHDPPDNPARPPLVNTTSGAWALTVQLPTVAQEPALADAAEIHVYLSLTPIFANPSWYDSFPVASGGSSFVVADATVDTGAPPTRPTAIGGAHQIDPDTEFVFGLRSPVAASGALPPGVYGDARIARDTRVLYAVLGSGGALTPSDWSPIGAAGGGGGIKGTVATWADLPAGAHLDAYLVEDSGALAIAANPTGAATPGDWWIVNAPIDWIDQAPISPDTEIAYGWRSPRDFGSFVVPARFGDAAIAVDEHELYAVTKTAGAAAEGDWTKIGGNVIHATQQGLAYTFALGDMGTVVESTAAAAVNFTIPPNSAVAFPVGAIIEVFQYGAGQVSIVAGTGVTLRSDAAKVNTAGQYATIGLRQRAIDEWVLSGDLA